MATAADDSTASSSRLENQVSILKPSGLPPLLRMRDIAVQCPQCRLASTHVEARCRRCNAELAQQGSDVWRRGKRLVARKGAGLPHRCVRCNGPGDGAPFVKEVTYVPLWAYLLIVLWLVPFLIAVMIIQKKTTLTISLCADHRERRRRAKIALISSLIGAPALWVLAAYQGSTGLAWLGVLVVVVGVTWAIWGMRMIAATKMDDHFVRVTGVSQDFLETLPDWGATEN